MKRSIHFSLIEAIGMAAAERLLLKFGGRRVYIPATLDAAEHLQAVLDDAEIETLCLVFGPGTYYFPRIDTLNKLMRNRYLRQRHREGENLVTLAHLSGLSVRHVRRIVD